LILSQLNGGAATGQGHDISDPAWADTACAAQNTLSRGTSEHAGDQVATYHRVGARLLTDDRVGGHPFRKACARGQNPGPHVYAGYLAMATHGSAALRVLRAVTADVATGNGDCAHYKGVGAPCGPGG
jgi:hypothetical protein